MGNMNESLCRAIDAVDNLAHALILPVDNRLHVEALRASLPDAVAELKRCFVGVTGENPWE